MSETRSKYRVLVVDDDRSFLTLFVQEAQVRGRDKQCEILTTDSGDEALLLAGRKAPDVVISDVQMPGLSGLDLFAKLTERYPGLPVILLTAYGSIDRAIAAVKMGAYHYFTKPLEDHDLFWKTLLEAAAKKRREDELEEFRREKARRGPDSRMVGQSEAWRRVVEQVELVAPLPSTVLITGETGTGKEVTARAIHARSDRSDRPFVAVSCLEFSGTLLESELFGHERGAFTGAVARKRGIFERAHGGTLFLDEIAETPPELQGKLLRVLEGSPFFRVGGEDPLQTDFRLIAATNREMEKEVKEGRFRQDLYFRLAVFPIKMPPLRDRKDDITSLTLHFLEKTARRLGRPLKPISGSALSALHNHDWPGNVRELENLIERAVIRCTGDEIHPLDLFPERGPALDGDSGLKLENMERQLIQMALERSGQNKTAAAELLGISRKTLGEKIVRYGLTGGQNV